MKFWSLNAEEVFRMEVGEEGKVCCCRNEQSHFRQSETSLLYSELLINAIA